MKTVISILALLLALTLNAATAKIDKVWLEHGVKKDNRNAMKVHCQFSIKDAKDKTCYMCTWVKDPSGNYHEVKSNHAYAGRSIFSKEFCPDASSTNYSNMSHTILLDDLNLLPGKNTYSVQVTIHDNYGNMIAQSQFVNFTGTGPGKSNSKSNQENKQSNQDNNQRNNNSNKNNKPSEKQSSFDPQPIGEPDLITEKLSNLDADYIFTKMDTDKDMSNAEKIVFIAQYYPLTNSQTKRLQGVFKSLCPEPQKYNGSNWYLMEYETFTLDNKYVCKLCWVPETFARYILNLSKTKMGSSLHVKTSTNYIRKLYSEKALTMPITIFQDAQEYYDKNNNIVKFKSEGDKIRENNGILTIRPH